MKKLVASLVALLLWVGAWALSECACTIPDTVKMAMYTMSTRISMSEEIQDSIGYLVMGGTMDCEEAKETVLTAFVEYYDECCQVLDEEKMTALVQWLCSCHCGCDSDDSAEAIIITPAPTTTPGPASTNKPKPTSTPHVHTGGSHQNGGTCTVCGAVYQEHVQGDWISGDSTWHYAYCTYPGCGYCYGHEYHHWDGRTYGTSDSGLVKKFCTICQEYSWVRVSSSSDSCGDSCDGDCLNCCQGCGCGCDCD